MSDLSLQTQITALQQTLRRHNHQVGSETPPINRMQPAYYSQEFDNGSQGSNYTIDWSKSNVQYITLTNNITLTFIGALGGYRHILQIAGAYTPTFPSNVRWSGGVTPTATASAGYKDIYSFVYSGKESLYDGVQSANFATT